MNATAPVDLDVLLDRTLCEASAIRTLARRQRRMLASHEQDRVAELEKRAAAIREGQAKDRSHRYEMNMGVGGAGSRFSARSP